MHLLRKEGMRSFGFIVRANPQQGELLSEKIRTNSPPVCRVASPGMREGQSHMFRKRSNANEGFFQGESRAA